MYYDHKEKYEDKVNEFISILKGFFSYPKFAALPGFQQKGQWTLSLCGGHRFGDFNRQLANKNIEKGREKWLKSI
ncbi:hypothetical protein JCM11672_33030 [Alkaliphilus crotonatoxidans]